MKLDYSKARMVAKKVLLIEKEAIHELIERIDENFDRALDALCSCKGRVVVTGMGKPGIIGRKISATLASTGTPSIFLHPAEAVHGDLGMVRENDVVLAISNSGETEEITRLLPLIKQIGAVLISLTGKTTSALAEYSDIILDISIKEEACPLGLAPTASTTASLAMGDALAMALLEIKGFKAEDYAFYHPGGSLGRKLLMKVGDIMRTGNDNPIVDEDVCLKDVLLAITSAKAGAASVIDKKGMLSGIFTDGDLRRNLDEGFSVLEKKIKDVMTAGPQTILPDHLAAEALKIMRTMKIDEIPVVDEEGKPVGMLDVQDLLKAGIM